MTHDILKEWLFGSPSMVPLRARLSLPAGIPTARRRNPRLGLVYTGLTLYLLTLWWGYPIVWGLAEGSNTITVNAEVGDGTAVLKQTCMQVHGSDASLIE